MNEYNIPEIRPIDGYDGYFISEIGEVYSIRPYSRVYSYNNGYIRGIMHEMVPKEDKDGYLYLGIRSNGKRYFRRINRLVASAFIPNDDSYPIVNHIDGNVKNNIVENLEWCNNSQNMIHSFRVLGREPSITTAKKVKLINRQTNEVIIFDSIKECAFYLNMSFEHLGKLLNGRRDINKWKNHEIYDIEYVI